MRDGLMNCGQIYHSLTHGSSELPGSMHASTHDWRTCGSIKIDMVLLFMKAAREWEQTNTVRPRTMNVAVVRAVHAKRRPECSMTTGVVIGSLLGLRRPSRIDYASEKISCRVNGQ